MEFSSVAEMAGVVEGWRSYNETWSILSAIGVQYIPFIVMFGTNWVEAARSGNSLSSLKPMEIDVYLGLAVYALFVAPAVQLNATAGGQSTEPIEVPVAWYVIQSAQQQLNMRMIERMRTNAGAASDETRNLIRGMAQLSHLGIRSETLRAEVRRFERECYAPALSKYQTDMPAGAGHADVGWIGSHWFLEHPGYYLPCDVGGGCYESGGARSEVPGFGRGAYGDGQPSCVEWWEGGAGGEGLLPRLVAEATSNPDLDVGNLSYLADYFGISGREGQDSLARAALSSMPRTRNITRGGEGADLSQWAAIGIGTAGIVLFQTLVFEPMLQIIGYGLPFLQSVMIYWLLFGLVFAQLLSFYAPQAIFALVVTYSTVAFWPVLFEANYRISEKLALWLFADAQLLNFNTMESMGFDLVVGLSTFLSLAVFTMLMGIVGYRGVSGINSAIGEVRGQASSAGKAGSAVTGKVAGG